MSDAEKRCTRDLGGIHASCLLLGVRVCVCVVLLLTHMHTHRKGRLHQEGEAVNFKQENTPIWYSCLIPKWNIQPKIFHPILKFWKPLRFDWEVQISASYRALCCVHLSCLPKLHTPILTSTVFLSLGTMDRLLGPSQSLLGVRGAVGLSWALEDIQWHSWPLPLDAPPIWVILVQTGSTHGPHSRPIAPGWLFWGQGLTVPSIVSAGPIPSSGTKVLTCAMPYRGLQQRQTLSVCTVQSLTSSYPGRCGCCIFL